MHFGAQGTFNPMPPWVNPVFYSRMTGTGVADVNEILEKFITQELIRRLLTAYFHFFF